MIFVILYTFVPQADKPVIYLYPEDVTDVSVNWIIMER